MTEWADGILQDILDRQRETMTELVGEVVEDCREALSVNVEYSGGGVTRSQPGEPPRRESGSLQDDTQSVIEYDPAALTVTGEVYWTLAYARFLEFGTAGGRASISGKRGRGSGGIEPRPFRDPAYERWAPEAEQRIGNAAHD